MKETSAFRVFYLHIGISSASVERDVTSTIVQGGISASVNAGLRSLRRMKKRKCFKIFLHLLR